MPQESCRATTTPTAEACARAGTRANSQHSSYSAGDRPRAIRNAGVVDN
jgi:hypothetical protein